MSRIRRALSPRVTQTALVLVLAIAAVFLADAEGGRQIADDAAVQRAAEALVSATVVTEAAAREALLAGEAFQAGIGSMADIDDALEGLDQRLSELGDRVSLLTGLNGDSPPVDTAHDAMIEEAIALAALLREGEVGEARSANTTLSAAAVAMRAQADVIRERRQAHIDATREGIAKVANAARFVVGFAIPAIVLMFLYRSLRIRQHRTLAKTELERERELRKKKDQFLASAAHHLNDPLSAVMGFAELLSNRSRSYNAAVRNEMIEMLAEQAQETTYVAEDLLVAARSDMEELSLNTTEIDLRYVLAEVTRELSRAELRRIRVSGTGVAHGDVKRVTQIVRNLIRNAVAHGGSNVEARLTEALNRVVLEIADDGDGIRPGHEHRIFEAYYTLRQVDGAPPAMGLGLSVARSLARAMGGDLEYDRVDGESVFRLTLPRARAAAITPIRNELVVDRSEGQPGRSHISGLVADGGPLIVYQPIVSLQRRERHEPSVVGYEGLSRFPFASPPEWFRAARASGLQVELELACIRAAIRSYNSSQQGQFLALNISDESLNSPHLLEALDGIDPSRLILELSETAAIRNYRTTRSVIDSLQQRGIRLAVDDVGAEEIDLWHIVRLGASVVKIDMSLVREIDTSPTTRGLIRAIQGMADEIGAMVIAEGVETETEHNELAGLGVEFGQGYLYGKPEPLRWAMRVLSG